MPSLAASVNLAAALEAMAYTAKKLKFGHTNVVKDAVKTPVREIEAINRRFPMRREIDQAHEDRFVNDDDAFRTVRINAEKAEKYGVGNCEEQASTAFMYLYRLQKVSIDYCRWKVGMHAFVLVGRVGETSTKGTIDSLPWFEDAVICDPQDGFCGYWSKLLTFYPATNVVPMLHREPGVLPVWQTFK